MTDQRRAVAAVFDRAAPTYDQVGVDFFSTVGAALVNDVHVVDGDRVLDVGCGRGAALFPAVEAAGPAGAVGIDLAPTMVELTSAEAARRGYRNVTVEVGDAQAPELENESFDVILSSLVIFFLPDPRSALRAWRAALRPGGRLGLTTFTDRDDERWRWLEQVFPDRDPRSTRPGEEEEDSPFSSDERLHALLESAGFRTPLSRTREHRLTFDAPEVWLRWSWSHGMRAFWERIPEGNRRAVEAKAVTELARMADEPEGLTLRMVVRYTTATAG
jgi:ubiquinone/menaquinone biosynthesis C-methylase UbiE